MTFHDRVLGVAGAVALGLLAAPVAHAQSTAAPTPTPPAARPSPQAQVNTGYRAAPTVRLFGVPTTAWAPVDPPYSGTAYRTLGGQAETSADAVAEQGTPWH